MIYQQCAVAAVVLGWLFTAPRPQRRQRPDWCVGLCDKFAAFEFMMCH